jgi:hypothetical protein
VIAGRFNLSLINGLSDFEIHNWSLTPIIPLGIDVAMHYALFPRSKDHALENE